MLAQLKQLFYGRTEVGHSVYAGDILDLPELDHRLHIARSLVRTNGLYIDAARLLERIEEGRLLVRYDRAHVRLIACTGAKPLCARVRDALLDDSVSDWSADPADQARFLRNVCGGHVREKGWSFNAGDRAAFRQMNVTVLSDLRRDGYGAHQVFALIREGNERAYAHIARYGFERFGTIRSPYSENTLIVYVWVDESVLNLKE